MALAVAILAMAGSLCAAVGSGLQAREDFTGFRAVLEELGVPRASTSLKHYLGAFISLMPAAKVRREHPRIARANPEFEAKFAALTEATNEAWDTLNEEWRFVRQRARDDERARTLKRKAMYWSLILLGSLALFAAALVAMFAAA